MGGGEGDIHTAGWQKNRSRHFSSLNLEAVDHDQGVDQGVVYQGLIVSLEEASPLARVQRLLFSFSFTSGNERLTNLDSLRHHSSNAKLFFNEYAINNPVHKIKEKRETVNSKTPPSLVFLSRCYKCRHIEI